MIDERASYERAFGEFRMPEPAWDRLLGRRHRKRRNQRLVAGVVGMAVFLATIWVVSSAGPLHRGHRPAQPGPVVSTPPPSVSPAPSPLPPGTGFSTTLPPVGTAPSTPVHGAIVLRLTFGHTFGDPGRFTAWLYEDGRFIWERLDGPHPPGQPDRLTGLVEQRLTPEGVEQVRLAVLASGLFDRNLALTSSRGLFYGQLDIRSDAGFVHVVWGDFVRTGSARTPTQKEAEALNAIDGRLADPASWLPASAWEDQTIRPYVASRYSIYLGWSDNEVPSMGLERLLDALPAPAKVLLRAAGITRITSTDQRGTFEGWVARASTDDARRLDAMLAGAGAQRSDDSIRGPSYEIRLTADRAPWIIVSMNPLLPDE